MTRAKAIEDYVRPYFKKKFTGFVGSLNETMVDNLIIYLVFQPDVCCEEYTFMFKCLEELAKETSEKGFFTLLGDLLDRNLYGRSSVNCFEQRLNYYVQADNISRIVAILMLVHQKVYDCTLKQSLELAIVEKMSKKERYSIADFRVLLRYSSMGTSQPLTPAFKNFKFQEVISPGSPTSPR